MSTTAFEPPFKDGWPPPSSPLDVALRATFHLREIARAVRLAVYPDEHGHLHAVFADASQQNFERDFASFHIFGLQRLLPRFAAEVDPLCPVIAGFSSRAVRVHGVVGASYTEAALMACRCAMLGIQHCVNRITDRKRDADVDDDSLETTWSQLREQLAYDHQTPFDQWDVVEASIKIEFGKLQLAGRAATGSPPPPIVPASPPPESIGPPIIYVRLVATKVRRPLDGASDVQAKEILAQWKVPKSTLARWQDYGLMRIGHTDAGVRVYDRRLAEEFRARWLERSKRGESVP